MRFELQRREEHSRIMMLVSPLLAVGLMLITGGLIFASLGINPAQGLFVYFLEPLLSAWSLQELVVKATPLILIGVGLSICYRSNTWNIGAEGQFVAGALAGSFIPIILHGWEGPFVFPAMVVAGMLGGALWALVPALLKVRFGANEILTSLLLVYVIQFLLDWLVRGPWRDPDGYNFPESRLFADDAITPLMVEGGRMHIGFAFAIIVALVAAFYISKTLHGFQVQVIGQSPRAARFAGFSQNKMVYFVFAISGALAGLAGILEVAGPIGQLIPVISPGYGFTAIIVAFLGRLNPIGVFIAGFVLALSYLGGEAAQVSLGMSDKISRVFQGLLLFYVLACDTFILYRLRWVVTPNTSNKAEAG
ncbi:MAG: sugar ABC transporter permease [Hyphomicrobiales bacterium]|nr:MAG: sugar ABC transporter permease [Hyphomicrobiales bacterium]